MLGRKTEWGKKGKEEGGGTILQTGEVRERGLAQVTFEQRPEYGEG